MAPYRWRWRRPWPTARWSASRRTRRWRSRASPGPAAGARRSRSATCAGRSRPRRAARWCATRDCGATAPRSAPARRPWGCTCCGACCAGRTSRSEWAPRTDVRRAGPAGARPRRARGLARRAGCGPTRPAAGAPGGPPRDAGVPGLAGRVGGARDRAGGLGRRARRRAPAARRRGEAAASARSAPVRPRPGRLRRDGRQVAGGRLGRAAAVVQAGKAPVLAPHHPRAREERPAPRAAAARRPAAARRAVRGEQADAVPIDLAAAGRSLRAAGGERARMSRIHRAAAEGFARSAEAYERGRPEYPDAAIEHVVELMRPGATVLDLAAGTGKLTRPLVAAGLRVVAVEPVPEMRAALPGALEGTAEAIPLGDGSVDAVTVGQAFHWFDGDAALAEIARVLRPGGLLGLIWNVKDESVDWIEKLGGIMEAYRGAAPRVASGAWKDAFDRTKLFTQLQRARFSLVHEGEFAAVVARVTAVSFIAAFPPAEFARVVDQVRTLLATHPETKGRTTFELPYRTGVYWCERV